MMPVSRAAGGVVGIGCDLIELDRVRAAIDRHGERFLRRVFTEGEIAYCSQMAQPFRHFAARFAAKEAVSKAFGTGIGGRVGWRSIEVVRSESGAPRVRLDPEAASLMVELGGTAVLISLSHSQSHALAFALITVGGADA